MTLREKSTAVKEAGIVDFSDVVDKACDKLMDRHILHSIRRLQEMEDCLSDLEQELDSFLQTRDRNLS